jgi:hypothetical protein
VIGTFNTSKTNQVISYADTILILGNGTGVSTDPPEDEKRNVLVYKDGTIIINQP